MLAEALLDPPGKKDQSLMIAGWVW